MRVHRRKVLKGLAATGVSVAALRAPYVHAQAPFKIGLLTVKTGPLAQGGIQMEQGIVALLKEKGNTFAGRKIDFISADTGGNPAGAKTKAQELIERDKVNVIIGPLAAFELLAILDYVRDNQTPLISLAAAEDVTQRKANPFIIRPSATSAQCCHVMGEYAAKELKFKRAATISEDFAFGYEQMAGFQRVFEDYGGRVVKKLWPPLVTPDYTPYIAQIGNVDCVFNGFAGSNPVKFMRSYADLGLKGRIPLLAGWTAMDDARCWQLATRQSARCRPPGIRPITTRRATSASSRAMQKDYNVLPGGYAAGIHCRPVHRGRHSEERRRLVIAKRWRKRCTTSADRHARGPLRFDSYGNAVGDVFIRKCERKVASSSTPSSRPTECQSVLDLRREEVPVGAGLRARLSAGEVSRIGVRARHSYVGLQRARCYLKQSVQRILPPPGEGGEEVSTIYPLPSSRGSRGEGTLWHSRSQREFRDRVLLSDEWSLFDQ
jgi:branched-chain amino acid transport system substrate-binding protein